MELMKPLMTSNRFENCLVQIPEESDKEESDSEMITKSTKQIDLKSLPQLRISLERVCLPVKTTPKIVERIENFTMHETVMNESESDDSSETVIVNQDINDKILAVNRDMELMEVVSDVSSPESVISNEDDHFNVINFEWKEEDPEPDNSFVIHDASEIFVCLERCQLPKKYESKDEIQETDECEEIGNNSGKNDTSDILLPKCFVRLERLNMEIVTPSFDDDDLSSPEGCSPSLYGYHLPQAVIRLERTPVSVFRKYGISIPDQSSSASDSSRNYSPREDKKMYCVLGIKLLFQKQKKESKFEQRMSELRDFVIPNRNRFKMLQSTKRRLKRLNRRSLSSRILEYDGNGNEIAETDAFPE